MNLDSNTAVHNGATVDGSYFKMGNVNVHDGAVQIMSDVGKNRVDIDKLTGNAGSTTVFMAPVGLMNLELMFPQKRLGFKASGEVDPLTFCIYHNCGGMY